jgi:hypothetical protein
MFGGLEIKSKSKEASGPAPAPAPPSGSSFGFLNTLSTPTPDRAPVEATEIPPAPPGAPAMSSFSFLQSTISSVPQGQPPPATTATVATSSAFSFMTQQHDPPVPTSDPVAMPVAPSNDVSGFNFLMTSPSLDASDSYGGTSMAPVVEDYATTESSTPALSSGFSFLSSSTPEPERLAVTMEEPTHEMSYPSLVTRTISSSSASSGVGGGSGSGGLPAVLTRVASNVSDNGTTAANSVAMPAAMSSALPAGAGITFGTSSSRNVVKKKIRSQRVGGGAPVPTSTNVVPAPLPPVTATTSTSASDAASHADMASAREAAVEASRRAEAFMQAKAVEEASTMSATNSAPPSDPARAPSSGDNSNGSISSSNFSPHDIRPSASTDEVVAAAQAAANEAKILQQQQLKGQGFMGTFFKGFRASPTPTTAGSTNSSHGGISNGVGVESSGINRTTSDRQMNQARARVDNDDDDDDDDVVVSTSVGGYMLDPLPPAPAPVSSFTPVTLPVLTSSTTSASTSFSATSLTKAEMGTSSNQEYKMSFAPPTPKKMKTPIQVFEEYQALFAQSVHRAVQQVEDVRSQQKMLREERFCAMAKDRLATQQIAQTESQLQVAVEAEEYELADQLGQVVEGHRREKQEVAFMLANITKALAQLNSQKTLVLKSVATCFDNLSVRLEELKEKEAATEQKDDAETFKQFSLISKQLSAEQERLQQDLKHLERDEQLVGEERKELEDSIKEQTGELETQKDQVSTELDEVQKEVEELRKRLESKQKEAADLRTKVFGLEDSISKVRVKFSRQLTRVDKKERALKESRSEWEMEDATHKRQKEAHELQVQSHSEALLVHDELMKTIESELKLSKEFCEIIPTQLGFGDGDQRVDGETDNGEEGDMAQLQADVVTCEAALGEAKIILKVATSVLANLQAERDGLVEKIPELENQKKAAAANRDFKAASKASKEIKDATTRIKECDEEIEGEAMSKKQAAEEEFARLQQELVTSQELALAKEKIAGLQKMESLALQISQLIDKRKEICGDCTSEENSVRGVGALVLQGQIKALNIQGQDLGSKFGGWTELMRKMRIDMMESSTGTVVSQDGATTEKKDSESLSQQQATSEPVDDGLTSEERVSRVRKLMTQISDAEKALEDAAAREDFDEAVRLEEVFQLLQSEVEKINLTDEEAELAMQEATPGNDSLPGQISSADDVFTPAIEAIPSNDNPTEEEDNQEVEEGEDQTSEESVPSNEDPASQENPTDHEQEKDQTSVEIVAAVPSNDDSASEENPMDDDEGKDQAVEEVVETEAQTTGIDHTEVLEDATEDIDNGNEECTTSGDPEESGENGGFEIVMDDEVEGSTLNGEMGNSKEVVGDDEPSVEVDQNGEGFHPEEEG